MKRKIPEKLYKYRSFNDENCFFKVDPISGEVSYSDFGLDGLSKGKIWFSHLDKLNDPYESEYDFDYSNYLRAPLKITPKLPFTNKLTFTIFSLVTKRGFLYGPAQLFRPERQT